MIGGKSRRYATVWIAPRRCDDPDGWIHLHRIMQTWDVVNHGPGSTIAENISALSSAFGTGSDLSSLATACRKRSGIGPLYRSQMSAIQILGILVQDPYGLEALKRGEMPAPSYVETMESLLKIRWGSEASNVLAGFLSTIQHALVSEPSSGV